MKTYVVEYKVFDVHHTLSAKSYSIFSIIDKLIQEFGNFIDILSWKET